MGSPWHAERGGELRDARAAHGWCMQFEQIAAGSCPGYQIRIDPAGCVLLLRWTLVLLHWEEGVLLTARQAWSRALQMTNGSPVAVLLGWKLPLASHLHVYGR